MASRKDNSIPAKKGKTTTKVQGRKVAAKASSKRKPTIDALTLLKQDHARVKKLLHRLQGTRDSATDQRHQLLKEIEQEIRTHSHIEEDIFYPAFKDAAANSDQHVYYEAIEEHHLVDVVLVQIKSTDVKSQQFAARAKVLTDLIEHHAGEEESEMFPKARKALGTVRLRELGQQMEKEKQDAGLNMLTKVAVAAGSTLARLMKRGNDPRAGNSQNGKADENS